MSRVVLDASALLAMLNGEAGADRVAKALPGVRQRRRSGERFPPRAPVDHFARGRSSCSRSLAGSRSTVSR